MRTVIIIALLASPLAAATAASAQGSATGNSAQAAKPGGAKDQKYCIKVEGGTGSRIESMVCRTKAEWRKQGVDVDSMSR